MKIIRQPDITFLLYIILKNCKIVSDPCSLIIVNSNPGLQLINFCHVNTNVGCARPGFHK